MSNKYQVYQTNVRLSAALRTRVDQFFRQNEQNYNLTSLISAALVEKLDREALRPTTPRHPDDSELERRATLVREMQMQVHVQGESNGK